MKNVEVDYHFVRECVASRQLDVCFRLLNIGQPPYGEPKSVRVKKMLNTTAKDKQDSGKKKRSNKNAWQSLRLGSSLIDIYVICFDRVWFISRLRYLTSKSVEAKFWNSSGVIKKQSHEQGLRLAIGVKLAGQVNEPTVAKPVLFYATSSPRF